MSVAAAMEARGILRAPEVIELAREARLDLASACVLLGKESGGGRNIWGHDPVPTGGSYDKGSAVTRDNYLAYRAARARGTAGPQGCGPTQLTFEAFQLQADAAGGCWDWRANTLTGFRILAGLIRVRGVRLGFKAYNGSGPAADRYADDAIAKLDRWRAVLTEAANNTPEVPVPITAAEMDEIARRCADAVARRPTVNAWGDTVGLEQILVGAEGRTADVQSVVHGALGGVDLDKLADRVVDRLAARLGGV